VVGLARRRFAEYFAGTRTEFDLPLVVPRGSEFERSVWQAIAAIPYGETRSYGAIARAVGEPGGAQAVGMACNRNPLPLVIACHRVIGSDGKLVGFGGGLDLKRFLLQLEARVHIERTFATGLT
jgi:methylated-DNA-[protein]-cysteine S-methyltransferase